MYSKMVKEKGARKHNVGVRPWYQPKALSPCDTLQAPLRYCQTQPFAGEHVTVATHNEAVQSTKLT